jgi:hypothetical protein
MAAKGKGGLALLLGPTEGEDDDEAFDESMYEDDLATDMGDDLEEGPGMGAFEAYADVVFNPESDPQSKAENLRLAIETIIEERGR